MTARPPASRTSWRIEKHSVELTRIPYEDSFSADELARIRFGVVPRAMEDKWFIFFEPPFLFFHRSWTGRLIYRLELEEHPLGARIKEASVANDPKLYRRQSDEYETHLVSFLVRRLLLGRNVPFPVPEGLRDHPRGGHQHHVVGLAAPEILVSERSGPTRK